MRYKKKLLGARSDCASSSSAQRASNTRPPPTKSRGLRKYYMPDSETTGPGDVRGKAEKGVKEEEEE